MGKTKFWDLCVRTPGPEEAVSIARELGWSGIGWILPWEGMKKLKKIVKEKEGFVKGLGKKDFGLSLGVLIKEKKKEKMRKIVKRIRKSVELIFVAGGDSEINRVACETPEVDVLLHPWGSAISVMGSKGESGLRRDPGMGAVMAKLAAKNRVSIGFGFNEILRSNKRARVQLMSNMIEAAELVRKAKTPFVLSAEAREPEDMRAPLDLASFGRILKLPENRIKKSLSGGIVKENRKRLGKKWIMPGVELE